MGLNIYIVRQKSSLEELDYVPKLVLAGNGAELHIVDKKISLTPPQRDMKVPHLSYLIKEAFIMKLISISGLKIAQY